MKIKKYTFHSLFNAYICGVYNLQFVSISFMVISLQLDACVIYLPFLHCWVVEVGGIGGGPIIVL